MWALVAAVAAIISAFQLIPQTWEAIRASQLTNVSLPTFVGISLSTFLWAAYGTHLGDAPIVLANSFACLCSLTVSVMKLRKG